MKRFGFAALALTMSLCSAQAQENSDAATTATAAKGASGVQSAAAEIVKHQQMIEKSIRDNTTDDIQKHAEAALKAAQKARKAAEAEGKADLASQAGAAVDTARQLVNVGKEGTYAENSSLITKLHEQAKALSSAAGEAQQTTGTLNRAAVSGNKKLNNTICPVSDAAVDSMGEPVTVAYKGEEVTLCCEGCRDKFMENADANLEKARKSSKAQQ